MEGRLEIAALQWYGERKRKRGKDQMVLAVILSVLILLVFRNQREESAKASKKETELCTLWLQWILLCFILAIVISKFEIKILSIVVNWLLLAGFPVLIISGFKKEKAINNLKEIGFKRADKKTAFRILLICFIYAAVIFPAFCLGKEALPSFKSISKILKRFPISVCLLVITEVFTEEFFFRGILQRHLCQSLKRPYIAILLSGAIFGLYHFPFAYDLWDHTVGSILYVLKTVVAEQAFFGCAYGLLYYKSDENLWSSIGLHAFSNAIWLLLGFEYVL